MGPLINVDKNQNIIFMLYKEHLMHVKKKYYIHFT